MNLTVSYFAWLREHAGASEETLQSAAVTPAELWQELEGRYGFGADSSRLRVAVNDEFAAWDATLRDGDHIVFIPPVSGG
ncbi:MAG: molybdopterin converting factor subunit 1 [Gammaproteobacteria bacterium]